MFIRGGVYLSELRGSSESAEHQVHGLEVAGSSPAPAPNIMRVLAYTWLISSTRMFPCVADARVNEGPQKGRVPG